MKHTRSNPGGVNFETHHADQEIAVGVLGMSGGKAFDHSRNKGRTLVCWDALRVR
jgi:hypothetical protein